MRVAKGCGGQHGDEKKEEGVALVVPPPYGGRQRPSLFTALVYGALCMLVSKEPMLRRNFRDRPMSQLGQRLSSASSLRRPESRSAIPSSSAVVPRRGQSPYVPEAVMT